MLAAHAIKPPHSICDRFQLAASLGGGGGGTTTSEQLLQCLHSAQADPPWGRGGGADRALGSSVDPACTCRCKRVAWVPLAAAATCDGTGIPATGGRRCLDVCHDVGEAVKHRSPPSKADLIDPLMFARDVLLLNCWNAPRAAALSKDGPVAPGGPSRIRPLRALGCPPSCQ
ncbi:unnamed protein product [Boreogadus saida]